jgi:hypothetical protein
MRSFRLFLVALAMAALASPAPAQSVDYDLPRRSGGGDGVHGGRGGDYGGRGGDYGGGRGVWRGRGGLGILPGLMIPAITEGLRHGQDQQADPPWHPHPRKVARPRPPRERMIAMEPEVQRPRHRRIAETQPAPERASAKRLATVNTALFLPPVGEKRFLANEVLVVFRDGTSEGKIASIARRLRLEQAQVRDLTLIGMRTHRFRFADKRSVKDVLSELSRRPQVLMAEPHYVFTLSDDAAKPEAVKVEAPAAEKAAETSPRSYAAALLRLPEAHKIATGRGVRVAVIDSLIDRAHPEIEGSIAESFDALEDASAPPHPHGTGMASAIVGHRQIDGAAPAAQILAVRAFTGAAGDAKAVGLDILAGVDWAARQKAQVINMSFAGPIDPLLEKMLAAAASRRIVLIAAAGNEGPRAAPLYPAADPHVVAVSAVDERTQIYVNDNRGPYIALAAPGVDVLVATPRGAYDLTTGTSVACAEVSGIAALLLEAKPNLDGPALRRLLQDTAQALAGVTDAGAGIADAQAAVKRLH